MRGLKFWTDGFDQLSNAQGDLETIWEFYEMQEATEAEVDAEGEKLEAKLDGLEFRKMMSDEGDNMSAVLEINAGAGGRSHKTGHRCCYACIICGPKKWF